MSLNTKHISIAVVLAIVQLGIFALTISEISVSSNGRELQGHPIILIINVLSLFGGLVFLYFAKWMRDAKEFKENQK